VCTGEIFAAPLTLGAASGIWSPKLESQPDVRPSAGPAALFGRNR